MVGSWDEKGNPNLNSVDLNPHEPYVADPLAGLPVPADRLADDARLHRSRSPAA